MLLCNIVHEVNKISILGESLMLGRNETKTKINFYITRTEYKRFKNTCKNQEISMLLVTQVAGNSLLIFLRRVCQYE